MSARMLPAMMATILPAVHFLVGAASAAAGSATAAGSNSRGSGATSVCSLVEPERRVAVGHQPGVGGDPEHPPVEAEHEVEDPPRVTRREQQGHRRDEDEHRDQARSPSSCRPTTGSSSLPPSEDRHHDVLRDGEQPPLDEDEPSRQPLRVVDLELRRVVRDLVQRERRVAVRAQRAVGVEDDAPRPAEHADVEVEDSLADSGP